MIVDTWANWRMYRLPSCFDAIERFVVDLQTHTAVQAGRHPIQGDDVYAQVASYVTESQVEPTLEAHREYVDVQCLVAGIERLDWAPDDNLEVVVPYDEARDVALLRRPDSACASVILRPGVFALLLPQDAHQPQLAAASGPLAVTKVVVKIRAGLLDLS